MKTNLLFILVVVICFLLPQCVGAATSVTKDNITWNFDGDYSTGQFVSGDWYIVAPGGLSITSISASGGETLLGSMLNPNPNNSDQGFIDISDYGLTYDPQLNVGDSLPLSMSAGDMLITTTAYDYFGVTNPQNEKNYTFIKEAAILTVVSSAPPAGTFRPGYCDTSRTMYNSSSMNYDLLANLPPTASAPSISEVEEMVARPWIDFIIGWPGRAMHPHNNMRDYGSEIASDIGTVALMLNSNFTESQKEPLAIGLTQIGIDLWSIVKNNNDFYSMSPAHRHGRKLPIMFAGEFLNISEIKSMWPKTGEYLHETWGSLPSDAYVFSEDESISYVTQNDIAVTVGAVAQYTPEHDYTSSMIGMPEWFHHNYTWRGKGNSSWTVDPYRMVYNSIEGIALSVYAMDLTAEWNHQAFFDYMDRYVAIARGENDGWAVDGETTGRRGNYDSVWATEMWDEHRDDFNGGSNPAPSCYDGIQNQDEEGIDCGGACPLCSDGGGGGGSACFVSSGSFENHPIQNQSSNFSISFKLIPNATNLDAVTGLSSSAGATWSDYATMVRFNTSGQIDARNGAEYMSDLSYNYSSGEEYLLEMDIDMEQKQYDVYVTHNSSRIQIADDYNFRTEQQNVSSLSYLGYISTIGTHNICDIVLNHASASRFDVNIDGTINTSDAQLVLRSSLGLSTSGTDWIDSTTTGDVNCDESVSSSDALLLLRYSLGLDMSGTQWCG